MEEGTKTMQKDHFSMSAEVQKPGALFYLGWIILNAAAVILGWYVAWALISLVENVVGGTIVVGGQTRITEDVLFMYLLFPVVGLLSGTVQYILLRRYLPRMAGWIPATFLGWLLPFAVGYLVTRLLVPGNSTAWILLGLSVFGAAIALPQWWMLRLRVKHAGWWVLYFAFGWGMVGFLNTFTSEPLPVILGIAVFPAITTSIACWILLDRLPNQELSSRIPYR